MEREKPGIFSSAFRYGMEAQKIDVIPFPLSHRRETTHVRAEHGQESRPSCPNPPLSDSPPLTKIQLLEQQVAQPCERVGILVELAEYKLEDGRIEQAIELLKRAIRCHSQATQPVLLLGKAWEAEGEYDKALETYLEALQRGVASAEVETVLFRQEFLLNTYPRSITELTVVAARRKSGSLWRLLARVCEINTDYDNARSFLTEALREDPRDIASLSMLASIAEKRREMEEATMWHRRILEINPHLPVSNLFLAQQYYARGEYAEALPYLARLRLKERQNRMYHLSWLLAHIHVCGIDRLEGQLEVIRNWQGLTPEEQALAQELFLIAGERSLEEGRARAEQYILQALYIAPSPSGSALLAEVERRKAEGTIYKKVLKTLTNEEKTEDEFSPTASLVSSSKDLRRSPEKEWQKRQAWRSRVSPWFASRQVGVSSSEEE